VISKKIKPNFKTLGKRLGKHMKAASTIVGALSQDDISTIEKSGAYLLEVEGEKFDLTLEDFEITAEDIPGWLVATDGPLTVALDVTLTPELEAEGAARDLVNRIQNIRKERDFNVTDRIVVTLQRHDLVAPAVAQYSAYIMGETLADSLQLSDSLTDGEEVEMAGETTVRIQVERV
jgi:isoleucyl-tRNA synthetase